MSENVAWLMAGAWTLAIYAVVPLARTIQHFVERHWGRTSFTYAVLVILVAALGAGLASILRRPRPYRGANILWLVAVASAYAGLALHLRQDPEEAFHLVEYGGLSFLVFRALSRRFRDPSIYATAAVITIILGIGDEFLQFIVPARYWDFRDIGINAIAGVLMQIALARGLRPAFIVRPVPPRSWLVLCRAVLVLLAVLAACAANTPPRMAWIRKHAPLDIVRRIDEDMIEYGHRLFVPGAGSFKSRLAPEELRLMDAGQGPAAARVLDRYTGKRYAVFFRDHLAYEEPFLYEARVRLFRRDYHLQRAIRDRADARKLQDHATIAFREQQILDAYFSNTVSRSSYRLPPEIMTAMRPLVRPGPYESPVSENLICSLSQLQVTMALPGAMLVVGLVHLYYSRRKK